MSIPRDSIVEIPGHGTTKINAAYAFGGPKLLVQDHRAEHRHPDRPLRRDRPRRLRRASSTPSAASRSARPTTMKDPLANLDIKKGCQEVDGATALGYARSRHTVGATATSTGPSTSARSSPRSATRWSRRGRSSTRCATGGSTNAIPDFFAFGEGTGPIAWRGSAWAMTRVDGNDGLTCVRPDRRPRRALGPGAVAADVRPASRTDRHRRTSRRRSAPRPACRRAYRMAQDELRDPRLGASTTTASPPSP